jgi:uncharacterized membrane protein
MMWVGRLGWIQFEGLLDLAFEQTRHYAAGDAAVSLRLMRVLGDIASTVSGRKSLSITRLRPTARPRRWWVN